MLQCLAEDTVKSQVGPQDVPLLPTVFFQFLNLRPKAVQILKEKMRNIRSAESLNKKGSFLNYLKCIHSILHSEKTRVLNC